MSYFFYIALAVAAAVMMPLMTRSMVQPYRWMSNVGMWGVCALIVVVTAAETSVVSIDADKVGIVRKIYGSRALPEGHFIAADGETGYQAETIPPGTFKVSLFYNVFNAVQQLPIVTVPNGFYGRIVANDGAPVDTGEIMAPAWPDADFSKYLDAEYFITHGGRKGLQLSVLKPGNYPLNLALFQVRIGFETEKGNLRETTKSTDVVYDVEGRREVASPLSTAITTVPAGFVGVVRSSVTSEGGRDCTPMRAKTDDDGLEAVLVPNGCKGIWASSLPPNNYYLNRDAYDVTLVSTRVTTLDFKGGFRRRFIDLKVDGRGDFTQTERGEDVPKSTDSADVAVNTKVEGWEIPQELRAVVQITPEHAPIVVAAVGGQDEVDKRIVVPSIRSHVRNVYGGTITAEEVQPDGSTKPVTRPTRVLDTVEHRPELEQAILQRAQVDGRRAGVDLKEIRLGEPVIPPELLLARQREQLAGQLKTAYLQEQKAQEQRQQTEQARSTADQQKDLVTAQIGVQTARLAQEKRQAEGRAERLYLEEQAAGQQAQTNVLGQENVMRLQMLKVVTELLDRQPTILQNIALPRTIVTGGQGVAGLGSAAAVLGSYLEQREKDDAKR